MQILFGSDTTDSFIYFLYIVCDFSLFTAGGRTNGLFIIAGNVLVCLCVCAFTINTDLFVAGDVATAQGQLDSTFDSWQSRTQQRRSLQFEIPISEQL